MAWYYKNSAGHETHGQGMVCEEDTGETIAIVFDGAAHGELLAAAAATREALRACLEALRSVRPITCDSEGADDPGGCDHCTALAAITKAEKALGEGVTE